MIERKYYPPHRNFITLNSRARRHSSMPYLTIRPPRCRIQLLSTSQLTHLFDYLTLAELAKFHQALRCSIKTREAAKQIVGYIAKSQRLFSVGQQKEFMGYTILRKRKLSKWRKGDRYGDHNDWQRINWDVQRTQVWYCRSRDQIQGMKNYLRKVIFKMCCEVNRFSYVQGFHCIIKAMFETRLTEHEAYLLGSYFLRELKLGRYYENRLQKMRQLCYVLDVYVYNNLPDLHFYLKKHDLNAQCYALGWFITLYSQKLPLCVLNRLWILFLLKGWKVLIKFGVALLCAFQNQLMSKGQGQLHEFLHDLQSKLTFSKQKQLWQLYNSIKVTNKMIAYLSRHMKQLQFDKQISISQLKNKRDNGLYSYEQMESIEQFTFPSYFSIGICCEKVEQSKKFPYCNDF